MFEMYGNKIQKSVNIRYSFETFNSEFFFNNKMLNVK